MGRRGPPPPDVGTVEVLDGWHPDRPAAEGSSSRRVAGVGVAVAVAGALAASSWVGGSTGEPGGAERVAAAEVDRHTTGATRPPARFERPIGHRVVVLTLTGLLVLDPDTGSYTDLDLGKVRSFSSAPAVASLGPAEVAVLFTDRSVGVVDLDERSVRRIAGDVQAVLAAADPGSIWIRRQRDDAWELVHLDASGRPLSVPLTFPGSEPPRMAAGRPLAANAQGVAGVTTASGTHVVEVHEARGTPEPFSARVLDARTGAERWLRGLRTRPVLTPGGGHLLVGEPITNRLTAYEVETFEAQTVQAPDSAGVTLDWENVAVLPPEPGGT